MQNLSSFKPSKKFLVCIDSDGCAMDTMNIKHKKCFGPKFVDVYGLSDYRDEVQALWEKVNLYSKTRGINRFSALLLVLRIIKEQNICPLSQNFDHLEKWVNETVALSNAELENAVNKTNSPQLATALSWSCEVNRAISALPEGEYAYKGVSEALVKISQYADIAVVSSANSEALKNEWQSCSLAEYTTVLAGQEMGTKADIIAALLKAGSYDREYTLMVGDAMGDKNAAEKNDILFFPILAGKEETSWEKLPDEAFEKFIGKSYKGQYQNKLIEDFHKNFS